MPESMPPTFRSQDPIPDGPYKATKLWNDVIETFREGMALGRHRYKLKASSECFPATDAVSWLHARLIENPNFGPSVSRQQAVQLMQKLHKAKVFEDVRGPKHNKIDFADNGRLFRFITSPVKPQHSTVGRTPLSMRTSLMNVAPPEDNGSSPVKKKKQPPVEKEEMKTRVQAEEDALTDCQVLPRNQLTEAELHSVYKSMTLNSLRKILKLHDVGEVFDTSVVSGCHIHHNLSFVNKNGIVTNVDKKDQLPHWVVSAMRCLAYWPDKIEEGFAAYPGFEKDVFKVVKDYFDNQLQPLIPHELYEAFANVMTWMEGRPPEPRLASYPSAEKLILNMTSSPQHPSDILIEYNGRQNNGRQDIGCGRFQRQSSSSNLGPKKTFYGSQEFHALSYISQARAVSASQGNTMASSVENLHQAEQPQEAFRQRCSSMTNVRSSSDTYGYAVALSKVPRQDTDTSSDRASIASSRPFTPPPYVAPPSYSSIKNQRNSLSTSTQSLNVEPDRYLASKPPSGYSSLPRQQSPRLADSFHQAMQQQGSMRRVNSTPALHQHGSTQGALRLCCLFLSPPQRRKLTLLLRFMQKMISNTKLVLDEHISTRDLVVTTFSHSILMPQNEAEYDDFLTQYQVSFMVDNYADLLRVPEDLRLQIEEQVAYLQRARVKSAFSRKAGEEQQIKYSHDATLQVNSKPSIVYCEQVTVQEYESQRMTASQQALHQLLENVIKDANMNHKDKRKRLKQFQKNYPAIYAKRFPTSESEKELFPEKPRIKPALMNQPLRFKLKSLRL